VEGLEVLGPFVKERHLLSGQPMLQRIHTRRFFAALGLRSCGELRIAAIGFDLQIGSHEILPSLSCMAIDQVQSPTLMLR